MIRFQNVYEKLSQAFDGVPADELGISDEVQEQVGLFSFLIPLCACPFVFFFFSFV